MTKEVDSKCSIMVQFRKFIKIINHIKMQGRVRCKTGWAILRQNCSIGQEEGQLLPGDGIGECLITKEHCRELGAMELFCTNCGGGYIPFSICQ